MERDLASTWFHLGGLAERQQEWRRAAELYHEALELEERFGDEAQAAVTCHQLGRTAEEQGHLDKAEGWFRKALGLAEKHDIDAHAAAACLALGIVESRREHWYENLVWMVRALRHAFRSEDTDFVQQCHTRLSDYYRTSGTEEREVVQTLLAEAGLDSVREDLDKTRFENEAEPP